MSPDRHTMIVRMISCAGQLQPVPPRKRYKGIDIFKEAMETQPAA